MSDITFQSMQEVFEQAFLSEKKLPVSITLSEADYTAFCESVSPKQETSEFERNLLGEEYIAGFEQQRIAYQRQRVTHVLCCVNAGAIPITFSRYLPTGKYWVEWERVDITAPLKPRIS